MKEITLGLVTTIGAISIAHNAQSQEVPAISEKEATPKTRLTVKQSSKRTASKSIVTIQPTVETIASEPQASEPQPPLPETQVTIVSPSISQAISQGSTSQGSTSQGSTSQISSLNNNSSSSFENNIRAYLQTHHWL